MTKKQKFILLIIIVIIVFLTVMLLSSIYEFEPQINSTFRQVVARCDKIVIRDGCYDPTEKYYSNKTLKMLDDPCDIRSFVDSINFSIFQRKRVCTCRGWPAIDFYRDGKIFMVTSVKHNLALCMPIKDYDVQLTNESRKFFENFVTGIEKISRDANN
jgi:hypothetical protein